MKNTDLSTISRSEEDRLAGLTPVQMKALTALLGGSTQIEAAAVAGVSRQQVGHWLHSSIVFRVNLKQEKLAMLRTARAGLAYGALEAVNFLRATLADPEVDISHKLKSATLLLASSDVDQAPSPWPTLNDEELMAAAELDHTSRSSADRLRAREIVALERKHLDRKNTAQIEEVVALDAEIDKKIAKVEARIRKLPHRRRPSRCQEKQREQLAEELDALRLDSKEIVIRLEELRADSEKPRDLDFGDSLFIGAPERHQAFVSALRREKENDG